MRHRFLALAEQGETGIQQLVASGEQEDVGLEFKAKAQAGHGRLERPDVKNLGKAISAFANSEGGLLIWGINARRDPDTGIDCARALDPIGGIELFKSQVNERLSEIIRPAHSAIEVALVRSSSAPDSGYLLLYVPRSERRPHMSRAPDDHTYWRRVGASSLRMEHGDIEDAFTRRRVGALAPVYELLEWHTVGTEGAFRQHNAPIRIGLRNQELVSARFPYLEVRLDQGFPDPPHKSLLNEIGLSRVEAGIEWHRFRGNSNVVIHPGETLWAVTVYLPVARRLGESAIFIGGQQPGEAVIAMTLRFGALDQPQQSLQLTIHESELKDTIPRR